MRRYNRITVFCDYGLDDAIATLHILKNGDVFERIDIVPVGGNVSADVAYRNAHTLLAAANADKNKVRIVDTRGIPQAAADIPDVHGADGMGDLLAPKASNVRVVGFDGYKNEVQKTPDLNNDCVLSLGPCTVPVLLGYYPNTVVAMGGTSNEPPNYNGHEFNEGMDTDAFRTFVKLATAVATLDSCHDVSFGFENLAFDDELADALLKKYISMCKSRNAFITVYDYVAALYVTNPELFVIRRVTRKDGVTYNEIKLKNS